MMKNLSLLCILFLVAIFFTSCKEDSPVQIEEIKGTSTVSGFAKYLNAAPGAFAKIELYNSSTNKTIYDTCDAAGKYSFSELTKGDYIIIFKKTSNEINETRVNITLEDNQNLAQDIYITYRMIDDFLAVEKNRDVICMQLQPHNANIGNNFDAISQLSGYYRRDMQNAVTLSCEIYKIPDGLNWGSPSITLTPEYVRENFEYLTEIAEEPVVNNNHEMKFTGETIQIILSNPPNGFAFVKKGNEDKQLKIPCVDFNNVDYGFLIFYK